MAKTEEMAERMTDFAVSIIELYEALPKTFLGRHIGRQLLRAGTAVTANHAEVRGAERRNDFIHKLGIVRKELYECLEWLRLLRRSNLLPASRVEPVLLECGQLCRIICGSRKTVQAHTGVE